MIKWNKETTPEPEDIEDGCNTYYLVKPIGFDPVKAMFLKDGWWTSYISKLMVDIDGWTEI